MIAEVKKSARRIAEVLLAVALLVAAFQIYGCYRERQGRKVGAIEAESAGERAEIGRLEAEGDGPALYRRAIEWTDR